VLDTARIRVYSRSVKKRSRFKTLREYVEAQPRQKSQGDIARELGMSESALSCYLNGKRTPGRLMGIRLSKELGIPLENLLNPDTEQSV
jgi:plasmid maintenance system antidote protein VapI